MERLIDEFELEPGFIINTDLRVEFDYNGCGECDVEFGNIWTRNYKKIKGPPRMGGDMEDGINIYNMPQYKAIYDAACRAVLTDIQSIHDEWVEDIKDSYGEY